VPSDAHGKYTVQVTFDLGPLAGKITSKQEVEVGR
jgi:hypothetical protein